MNLTERRIIREVIWGEIVTGDVNYFSGAWA